MKSPCYFNFAYLLNNKLLTKQDAINIAKNYQFNDITTFDTFPNFNNKNASQPLLFLKDINNNNGRHDIYVFDDRITVTDKTMQQSMLKKNYFNDQFDILKSVFEITGINYSKIARIFVICMTNQVTNIKTIQQIIPQLTNNRFNNIENDTVSSQFSYITRKYLNDNIIHNVISCQFSETFVYENFSEINKQMQLFITIENNIVANENNRSEIINKEHIIIDEIITKINEIAE